VFAIAIAKIINFPFYAVFFCETFSVIAQVYYFKYQKKRRGLEFAQATVCLKWRRSSSLSKVGFHESNRMRFLLLELLGRITL